MKWYSVRLCQQYAGDDRAYTIHREKKEKRKKESEWKDNRIVDDYIILNCFEVYAI